MPDPTTLVTAELLSRLQRDQFVPFEIVLSNGSRHPVPSPDHCFITPLLRRIEVEHDDGSVSFINPLHIVQLDTTKQPAR